MADCIYRTRRPPPENWSDWKKCLFAGFQEFESDEISSPQFNVKVVCNSKHAHPSNLIDLIYLDGDHYFLVKFKRASQRQAIRNLHEAEICWRHDHPGHGATALLIVASEDAAITAFGESLGVFSGFIPLT